MDSIDLYAQAIHDSEIYNYIPHEVWNINETELNKMLNNYSNIASYTRLLRYYLSSLVLNLNSNDILLDIGSGDEIYCSITRNKVKRCFANEINCENKISWVHLIEGDIFKANLPTSYFTKCVLGHTFEHFRGDQDTEFIHLLKKFLAPRGRCCIEPIFIGKQYLEVFQYSSNEVYDVNAMKIETKDSNFPGKQSHNMGFARIYNLEAFYNRVFKVSAELGFSGKLISFKLNDKYLPDMNKYKYKRTSVNYPKLRGI